MGIIFTEEMTNEYDNANESDIRYIDEHERLLQFIENDNIPSLENWLNDIKRDVEITVNEEDDGDRDNIMFNLEFVRHFMRLCKLLPLWSGISCQIFNSPSVTSSSSSVEGYFKDVKHTLKHLIPCTADAFVQNHIDGIDDAVITASQKYAQTIGPSVAECSNIEIINTQNDVLNSEDDTQQQVNLVNNDVDNTSIVGTDNEASAECIACKDGNLPSGAHTCIECSKNVHILDGCSLSIGSTEGYGSQRICIACHKKKNKSSKVRDAIEMNYEEVWARRSTVKRSKYLQPNPLFNITSETKKQTIGLLKNANLNKKPTYVKRKPVQFSNTCAFDALAQALAGAYAYYPEFRPYADDCSTDDPVMEIAIALAKK